MIFCRWVYGFLRLLQSHREGLRKIRRQSTKTEKRLIEELMPLARYIQTCYRQGLRIKVQWFAGSQPFDAKLLCSGSEVSAGFWPKETRCAWARKHYDSQRGRGKGHQAAVRSLAFKWIRILFRCWQSRTPYDETRYTESLGRRSALPNTDVQITWKNVAGFSKPAAFSA